MVIKKVMTNQLIIDQCNISDLYEIKDYKLLSIHPYVAEIKPDFMKKNILLYSFNNEKSANDVIKFQAQYDYVIYLYFEVECLESKEVILSIHNNTKKMKIWKNNSFISYLDGWYNRIPIKLDVGISSFLIEVINMRINDILITFSDLRIPLNEDNLLIYDDLIDVRKNHILLGGNCFDENGNILFSVRNDDKTNDLGKPITCYLAKKNINTNLKIEIIDSLLVSLNEEVLLHRSRFDAEEIELGSIIIGVQVDENHNDPYDFAWKRVYLTADLSAYIFKMDSIIRDEIINEKETWKQERFYYKYKYIVNRNCDVFIKYYLYLSLLEEIVSFRNYQSFNHYLSISGKKEIFIVSKLDEQVFKCNLYVPKIKREKIPMIIIVSHDEFGAYMDIFSTMYPDQYLIVECSTRGKTFGNHISESTIFEIIEYLYSKFSIDSSSISLFGHSSSGTVVSSLISKYPEVFLSALMISCLSNVELLKNTQNNMIVNVCGDLDEHVELHYNKKVPYFHQLKKSYNILMKNMNNATTSILMRNKTLIDHVLHYRKDSSADFEYITDNLYYAGYGGVRIIKKTDPMLLANFSCKKGTDKWEIIVDNVEILKLIDAENKTIVIRNSVNCFIGICMNNIEYFRVNEDSLEMIHSFSEYEIAKYKLEILNIYLGPLKIVHQLNNDELSLLKSFCSPKKLSDKVNVKISYPVFHFEKEFITDLKESNYLFFNCSLDDVSLLFDEQLIYIQCYQEGFSYKSTFYPGDYCVFQIVPNINHPNYFVAFINYNKYECASRNLFIRDFKLPSDHSASRSFYRNTAIIYYQNKYLCINYYGDEIKPML